MRTASVYWIHHKNHTDMFSDGYIGVSMDYEKRWAAHEYQSIKGVHENQHFAAAITKYGWENLIKEIIVIAEESYCYNIENKLRNKERIGWNIAVGGSKPPISKPRGHEYVSPLKGKNRETPWMEGKIPWNVGKTECWSIEQKEKFVQSVSKSHSKEHIKKRQESRKITRIAKGQIKSIIVNNLQYESVKVASDILNIPVSNLRIWASGKNKPSKKYKHIIECRWA